MPATTPMPTKNPGDVLTSTLWNSYLRDNIDKLLTRGHRVLTVAQFAALTGLEGTKGTVAPDEVYLEVDSANGIQWHLAYESGETTYKWRFLGGPAMTATVATLESSTSTAYADLATAGPSITCPRAGDMTIVCGAMLTTNNLGIANSKGAWASPKIGAATAVDADGAVWNSSNDSTTETRTGSASCQVVKTVAASDVVKVQYRASVAATGMQAQNRRVAVTPVRLI